MKRNRMEVVVYYPDGTRQFVKTRPGKSMTYQEMAYHLRYFADICDRLGSASSQSADAVARTDGRVTG